MSAPLLPIMKLLQCAFPSDFGSTVFAVCILCQPLIAIQVYATSDW